ncbi:MAG TPA: RyR domain-containing protein [Thermoanaerobaculia bacterium]|nr:RyR domain-containing protein [Thermoanaerobaculia bacterium]
MAYTPAPMDTSHVVLPPAIDALTEELAKNAHELWAAQRIAAGWSYGPKRDDSAKHHPCLVPYEELPDAEREYDRQNAMGTLKAIIALGFEIRDPADAMAERDRH